MTKEEFIKLTGWNNIGNEDFDVVNTLYMHIIMNKNEFCEDFMSMQANGKPKVYQLLKEISNHINDMEYESTRMIKDQKQQNDDLADFLIGKAHAYKDTDFRNQAVRLIGESDVVKRTIESGLPLFDEDKDYILTLIK